MSSFVKAAFVFPLLLAACTANPSRPSPAETKAGALGAPSVSTDHPSYQPGSTITVSYAGLPGNNHDWIAIAPAGSPHTSVTAFVLTFGQTSGTATFSAPADGSYVARAFANDDYIFLAESAVFTVNSTTISTDQSSYTSGSTITVSYAGLPGNNHDWIAIAPAGSPHTSVTAFVLTFGQTSGTATFSAPAAGSYVARAFANDDYIFLAETAAFTVTGAPNPVTISTDMSSYTSGSTITVSYAGLPGNNHDWIAIAPAGSPHTSVTAFVLTFGQTSGTATFSAPAAGSYVARAFANDDYIFLAETAAFTVTAAPNPVTISTDMSSYPSGSTITVSYAGLPGNNHDWIAIAPAGSPHTSVTAFVLTFGQTSGTATFSAPAAGSYVARAFANDDYIFLAETAAFTVTAPVTISTDMSSYTSGSTITVSYAGLPGNNHDWIAIAPAGSPHTSVTAFVLTFGQTSGTATFSAPAAGSYVARAFANDDYIFLAETASFTVTGAPSAVTISTDQSSYTSGSTITVSYAGLPGNNHDWIAIAPAGSPHTSVTAFVLTFGQTSGTATFSAPANGLYVARAFANDDYIFLAETAVFTVCSDAGELLCFVAKLSGAEENPPNSTTASGSAVITFDPATRGITYQVQHTVVGASAGHIHQAPALVNGPVIVPFTLVGQGASGSAVLTEGQAADLQAGNLYTNIHSPTFPGGEVRGQILRPGQILFFSRLTSAQEVPPNGSTATGQGFVIFDTATLGITYQMSHTVVGAVAGHIHQAAVGVNGPVIVPFTLVGQGASGSATLTAAQASALQSLGCYMNIHSPTFPGGEIRGVLSRPGT